MGILELPFFRAFVFVTVSTTTIETREDRVSVEELVLSEFCQNCDLGGVSLRG